MRQSIKISAEILILLISWKEIIMALICLIKLDGEYIWSVKTEGLCLQEMICRSRWGNKQTVIFSSSDVTTKMLFTLSPHGGLISKNQVYLSLSSNGYYGCNFTEIFQLDTLILILFIYIFLFLTDFYKFISLSWWMHVYGALKTYKTVSYTVPFYRVWNNWLLKR